MFVDQSLDTVNSVFVFLQQFIQNFVDGSEQILMSFGDANGVFVKGQFVRLAVFALVVKWQATQIGFAFNEFFGRKFVDDDKIAV